MNENDAYDEYVIRAKNTINNILDSGDPYLFLSPVNDEETLIFAKTPKIDEEEKYQSFTDFIASLMGKVRKNAPKTERNEKVFTLYVQGKNKQELSEIFGVTVNRISQIIEKQASIYQKSVYRLHAYEKRKLND
jgi:hypothetical protein